MNKHDHLLDTGKLSLSVQQDSDKQVLALDALSKLAKQFSSQPQFERIIDVLLLTMCGQFSVANAFALFQQPGIHLKNQFFFASGRFKKNDLLSSLVLSQEHNNYFFENNLPHRIAELKLPGRSANLTYILNECDVRLVAPLIHGNRLIGIVGLGEKVNRKPFDDAEVDLLATIVNTITPFVANSFLFLEMANLSEWYLNILDNVKQGVFVFDSHNALKKVNATGFKILKTFKPDLQNIDALYHVPIDLIFPDGIFRNWTRLLKTTSLKKHGRIFENLKAKSGEIERIYNVRISTIAGGLEKETDLIITLDDVTLQKENELRLFDLEKFAEKGVMASSIAHELNNFLALILGGVEMTQLSLERDNREKADSTLERIKGTVSQMERFTAGLMDYTRMNTAKDSDNLNSIIGNVLSFVSAQKKFRHINISTDFDAALPEFAIDSDQIAQLLLNFLNNAADAINEAKREMGQITVKTVKIDNSVDLSVSDNGIGVNPEVKDRLFKAHLTTKKNGHGYGLVTCAKIIQNHNGEIKIDSVVGKGTTITLRFPIVVEN
nr:GHKL domain-containing protein [candidate division Zixibacteria bacterium]